MSDLTPSPASAQSASPFDAIRRTRPDGSEYWAARDLMPLMGYARWENFSVPLERAQASARAQGQEVGSHFLRSQEKTAGRPRTNIDLSRFAAYLVAMNGDPNMPEVAAAQAYFAIRTREAEVARPAPAELPGRRELAQMVLDAEDRADREAIARARVEYELEQKQPIVEYHERFVAEADDIVTVDNFASQFGTTGPKVRDLMKERGVAVRKLVGRRWSKRRQQMVEEFEWRPRQGQISSDWFVLRPQHNVARLHNGQVRQTLYVRQFHAAALASRLGLTAPALDIPAEVA